MATPRIPHYGAFESTKIHGSGTDILATTNHLEMWREDLDMLRAAGINDLRYSVPWHRIEARPGEFDFSWMDGPMEHLRRNGMDPVVDLLHHTSFPDWLENGFANPEFPELYARFVQRFIERYEWVNRATVFNEPLATTLMCTTIGAWYPHDRSDRAFVRMAGNVARAICLSDAVLRRAKPNYQAVYIDTCESHQALDRKSEENVAFMNARRFFLLDLVLGRAGKEHPLFSFFTRNGLREDETKWLADHAAVPHILGLDYYAHSEMGWYWNKGKRRADISTVPGGHRGFADSALDYVERYQLPIMLTETNIRGTIFDRITWLRFMEEESDKLLDRGIDMRGFCWYPSIDSTDWANLCARCTGCVDPQGIWYLDEADGRRTRFASELSDLYMQLAQGKITHRDMPAYHYMPPLDRALSSYAKLTRHWDNWREAPGERKVA